MILKMGYAINGVIILLILNIIVFITLLTNKILNKKKKKRDEFDKSYYENIIRGYLLGTSKSVPIPNSIREMAIFKSAILEAFHSNVKNQRPKLLEIARQIGLVKSEMDYLNNGTGPRRAIAAYCLGEMRAKESIDVLLKNKKTKDRELAECIHRALVLVSGTEYLDRIIDSLGTNHFSIKPRILNLISLIDEVDIFPKMEEYLNGNNILKKVLALEALGVNKDIRVASYIEKAIISDEKELKVSGLKALIGVAYMDFSTIMPKLYSLKDDDDWEVRAFLAKALCFCKDLGSEGIDILKTMMEDSNWFVRFNSSESLLNLGEVGIVALSETLLSNDRFARDRAWDILNREYTLYNLSDSIKNYENYGFIIESISDYENSLKGGALIES